MWARWLTSFHEIEEMGRPSARFPAIATTWLWHDRCSTVCSSSFAPEQETIMKTESFETSGGLKIFWRSWRPEGRSTRAVLVIVHGFNAHSGMYAWVAEQLVARGVAVYALDLRGRGKSDGDRFYVEELSNYEDDVAAFVKIAKAHEPSLPIFLLGHSAGGVVSCLYALDYGAEIAGLICESFAFQVYAPDFALAVMKGLSHIAPHAHVVKLPNAAFSRDPKVVEAMNNDPLIANEVQPTRTMAAMVRGDARLKKEFPLITLPVLILHGTSDKATKPAGSQFFFDNVGSQDKTLKLYEGHFHDLLNDLDKEVVMADITSWLDEHISRR
jgi:acylglycerol lipase